MFCFLQEFGEVASCLVTGGNHNNLMFCLGSQLTRLELEMTDNAVWATLIIQFSVASLSSFYHSEVCSCDHSYGLIGFCYVTCLSTIISGVSSTVPLIQTTEINGFFPVLAPESPVCQLFGR